jgi:hypothetical protein
MKKKTLLSRKNLKTILFSAVLSICATNVWAKEENPKEDEPIYLRFGWYGENIDYDDTPRTLEFVRWTNTDQKLYENSGDYLSLDQSDIQGDGGGRMYNKDRNGEYKRDSLGNIISFLGVNNSVQYEESTNYAFYVDTAYVNRGTGLIKPQYMLAVDTHLPNDANSEYVIGRYLYNSAMYAKDVRSSEGRTNFNKVQPIDQTKTRNPNGEAYYEVTGRWERLAFAWAIHKGDSLYVLKGAGLEPVYNGVDDDSRQLWLTLSREYGVEGKSVDFNKLISENIVPGSEYQETYYRSPSDSETRTYYDFKPATALSPGKTIGLQAIIALDDNTHKDWVFSFRFYKSTDPYEIVAHFVIETETTDRNTQFGDFICPGFGGYIQYQNNVPVITRCDERELMADFDRLAFIAIPTDVRPVSNKSVTSNAVNKTIVIGGTGNITILNAANKKVIISDILGRTVANIRASSDNISVVAPSGIIIVAIECEKAVKVIVK